MQNKSLHTADAAASERWRAPIKRYETASRRVAAYSRAARWASFAAFAFLVKQRCVFMLKRQLSRGGRAAKLQARARTRPDFTRLAR